MKVKEESENWLKTQHSKNEDYGIFMTSHSLHGQQMENNGNSDRSYLWGSKITEDGDSSHDIKRCLLLGRKAMTNLDSILKARDITLPTKVCLIKAMVFPVVIYGFESLNMKKAEAEELMLLNCGVGEDS